MQILMSYLITHFVLIKFVTETKRVSFLVEGAYWD